MTQATDTDLFARLVRSKRDAENGSDDPPKPDDLINTAAHNVHRDGKAYPAVGSAWGVDGCVDTYSKNPSSASWPSYHLTGIKHTDAL